MKKNILYGFMNDNLEAGLLANIVQQNDEGFINKATDIIEKFRVILEKNPLLKNSEQLMIDNNEGLLATKELEDLFTNRFLENTKANFKILADLGENAFAYPVTPNTSRSILKDNKTTFADEVKEILDILSQYEMGREEKTDKIGSNTIQEIKNLLNDSLKSSKNLEEALNVGKVELNLKTAAIKGLPDDFRFIMGIDFLYFFKHTEMSNREILAILLHEIGHCYTFILDLYRKAKTNVMLNDLFANTPPEKVILTLSKEFEVPLPKTSGTNTNNTKEMTMFITSIFENIVFNKKEAVKNTATAERFADQFAVRMGLGPELFRVINLNGSGYYSEIDYMIATPIIDAQLVVLSILALLFFIITGMIEAVALPIVGLAFRGLVMVIRIGIGTDDANGTIYDDSKRRLESIRNEFVRRINSLVAKDSSERELVKLKILELDELDREISNYRKNRSSLGMIGEMCLPWLRKKSKETLVNELLENMEANKLQVLSEKLKLSGGL